MPETTQELPPELTFHFIKSNAYRLYIRMALGAEFSLTGFLRFHFSANVVLSPKLRFDLFRMTAKHTGKKKLVYERRIWLEKLNARQNMQQRLQEIVEHLRENIDKVDEPQFKAMFETSAEVLKGLIKAFRDYEQRSECAWQVSRKAG